MIEFLKVLVNFFELNQITYMLSGSVAMSLYTLPRFTRDFDFVVHLKPGDVKDLVEHFKEGYYCDEDAIRDAILNKSMFNVIDHKSSYKADFIILKNEPYRITEFERRRLIDFFEMKIYVVSPEDLLLSKIIWVQETQSSLQFEDIRSLSSLDNLDRQYIDKWIDILKLNTFNLLKK
ncbi:MAG: hypothetical protein H7Z13_13845 [Ferruginibacter sp.]|nr:hypothetical protein [Ferruginibacter sp.]